MTSSSADDWLIPWKPKILYFGYVILFYVSDKKKCASLYIISAQLVEQFHKLYLKPGKPQAFPQIAPTRDEMILFEVVLEDVVLMSANGFYEAVVESFAVFYIFNVNYPPSLAGMFSFLHHALLNIEDSIKKDNKVQRLLNKLNE